VLGYLANPRTEMRIEIQVPPKGRSDFEHEYRRLTGYDPPPIRQQGYSVLARSSDKRAAQKRIIFTPAGNPPPHLVREVQNDDRPSPWRVSRNLLVDRMLACGFIMGHSSGPRIRARIDPAQHAAFDRGYQMANE